MSLPTRRLRAAHTTLLMALAPAMLLLALAGPAHAGTWQFSDAGSTGSATLTHVMGGGTGTQSWTPPGTSTGSYSPFGYPHGPFGSSGDYAQ